MGLGRRCKPFNTLGPSMYTWLKENPLFWGYSSQCMNFFLFCCKLILSTPPFLPLGADLFWSHLFTSCVLPDDRHCCMAFRIGIVSIWPLLSWQTLLSSDCFTLNDHTNSVCNPWESPQVSYCGWNTLGYRLVLFNKSFEWTFWSCCQWCSKV